MFMGKPSVNRGKITSTNSTHPTPKPAQQISIQLNASHTAPLSQSDLVLQPKVTGTKGGWFSLLHKHKSRLDFPKPDIQAVKRGFLPSMSAVSPFYRVQQDVPTAALR